MRAKVILMGLLGVSLSVSAQRYYTKSARISFFSKAPLENITAVNKTAACILDTKTGAIQFSVLIKGFEFPKALMQEHFNENYLESDKYPRGEFKGVVLNNSEINYNHPGNYAAHVKGQLNIHGITKEMEASGTIQIGTNPEVSSEFIIELSDYNIKIPALVKDKVSNQIKIMVAARLDPFNN
jgi:flagellar basal body P-ring protein FlgI